MGGFEFCVRGGLIFLLLGDLVFGGVEVVDEALAGGLVCVFQGGDVGALAFFVGVEAGEAVVDGVEGGLGVGDVAAGVEDGLERLGELRIVVGLVEDKGELVVVGAGELVGVVEGDAFRRRGGGRFRRSGEDAEAVDGGGGLLGLGGRSRARSRGGRGAR